MKVFLFLFVVFISLKANDCDKNSLIETISFNISKENSVIEVDKDTIFNQQNIGNIRVVKKGIKLTFKAPKNDKTLINRQIISSIEDKQGAVYIFQGGDYHIKSLNIDIKRESNIEIYKSSRLYLQKLNIKSSSIKLNSDKNPKELLLYVKDELNIDSKNIKANLYLYSQTDININSLISTIKGSLYSQKDINLKGMSKYGYITPKELYPFTNGCYSLPDKPDEDANNKTLSGIDSNDNGVRDDVEIKIINENSEKLTRLAYFQIAKGYNRTLLLPLTEENAYKTEKIVSDAGNCERYLKEKKLVPQRSYKDSPLKYIIKMTFNTKDRIKTFYEDDSFLSGGVFKIKMDVDGVECMFDIKQAE